MRRTVLSVLLALSLVPADAAPARAQAEPVQRVAIGTAAGFLGGAVVTVGVIVARARFQREYLDSADDLIHWQTAPLIAAPAAGVVFGLAGDKPLRGSIVGSVSGMLVGAAAGAGLGWLLSEEREWPWAGGVIGAGVGLTLGGLAGGLTGWRQEEDPGLSFPGFHLGLTVPVR